MTGEYTVKRYGTDSSGRPILMTAHMHGVIESIKADPRIKPFAHKIIVTQGAFMEDVPGGGAEDSGTFHDRAGCCDFRTWNLSTRELDLFIRVGREHGFALWRRNEKHGGMEEHAHGVLGSDFPLTPAAAAQWHEYVTGGDGLKGDGRDYEWRPVPLVLEPPEDPDMALLNELTAVCVKHGRTRVYGARLLMHAAWEKASGFRKKRLGVAKRATAGMDDPK